MRILLTNDDGIHAPGLKLLERIAQKFSDDVFVVAPETDQSGVAHSLSLSNPLRLREITPRHFAVQGTPTDCVIMGVRKLIADRPPDLVLSGVNRGQNVAEDVTYSGTIAAAMEGTLLGVKSIALSQAYGGARGPHRARTGRRRKRWRRSVISDDMLDAGIPAGVLINVNFPACEAAKVAGVAVTSQGRRDAELMRIEQRRDGRAIPYYWLMFQRAGFTPGAGTDLAALAANKVSVTPLRLDLTDDVERLRYAEAFAASHEPERLRRAMSEIVRTGRPKSARSSCCACARAASAISGCCARWSARRGRCSCRSATPTSALRDSRCRSAAARPRRRPRSSRR